jgi:hypothetical protein
MGDRIEITGLVYQPKVEAQNPWIQEVQYPGNLPVTYQWGDLFKPPGLPANVKHLQIATELYDQRQLYYGTDEKGRLYIQLRKSSDLPDSQPKFTVPPDSNLEMITFHRQHYNVGDLEVMATMATLPISREVIDRIFRPVSPAVEQSNPSTFASRLRESGKEDPKVINQCLAKLEEGMAANPNNPFMRLCYAEMLIWAAMAPIHSGQPRNNGVTSPDLDKAADQANKALTRAKQLGLKDLDQFKIIAQIATQL